MGILKSKQEKDNWDRFKVKKKDYVLMEKEIKKTLIDTDDDYVDAIDIIFPDLSKEEKAKIMILADEYEIHMEGVRNAINKYLSLSENEED